MSAVAVGEGKERCEVMQVRKTRAVRVDPEHNAIAGTPAGPRRSIQRVTK
jgi:hypothetical protein